MNIIPRWGRREATAVDRAMSGFETAARTHPGSRSLNEDRILARAESGLWAVADGMGGHRRGDLAAETVIAELQATQTSVSAEIVAAINRANRTLQTDTPRDSISGSTVVALAVEGSTFHCFWAGDSELWVARDGEVTKLTRDHSVVEELVRSGIIEEADRRSHPQAHLITRAVGASPAIDIDEASGTIVENDLFLVCSDGLTNALAKPDLGLLLTDEALEIIADKLLALALERGASDNVSFILVRAL